MKVIFINEREQFLSQRGLALAAIGTSTPEKVDMYCSCQDLVDAVQNRCNEIANSMMSLPVEADRAPLSAAWMELDRLRKDIINMTL